jgi:methyl-accepting chemotaxis protein
MDEVTQQNSALVEENAAAAKSLEQQSKAMDERVSFFRLSNVQAAAPAAPARRAAPAQPAAAAKRPAADAANHRAAEGTNGKAPPKRGVVGRMQAAIATAFKQEPDWKEF